MKEPQRAIVTILPYGELQRLSNLVLAPKQADAPFGLYLKILKWQKN